MPDSKSLAITQEARFIAAEYLKEHDDTSDQAIGEIIGGKRDYAPAVKIAQFTLDWGKAA